MDLSEILREKRKGKGLTQKEVAQKLFVSRQAVSNWETGKNFPDFPTLILLTDLYQSSLDKLVKQSIAELDKDNDVIIWKRYGYIALVLSVIMALSVIITVYTNNRLFVMIAMLSWLILMFFCWKLENIKKRQNIRTYHDAKKFLKTPKKQ